MEETERILDSAFRAIAYAKAADMQLRMVAESRAMK